MRWSQSRVDDAIQEQQPWTVFLMEAGEIGDLRPISSLRDDSHRAAGAIVAGGDVESVQVMFDRAVDHRLRHKIHGAVSGVDNWSSDDSFLVITKSGAAGECLVRCLGSEDSLGGIGEV